MVIWGLIGVASFFALVHLAILKFKESGPNEQVSERAAVERQKDLEALGRELEYKILEPLQGAPNLLRATRIETSIISDRYRKDGVTHKIDKIIVEYTFAGKRADFERVKAEYVRPLVLDFLKENSDIRCKLDCVHQPNSN